MFGMTHINGYVFGHIFWSEARFCLALLMGAAVAAVMLTFMLHAHKSRALS